MKYLIGIIFVASALFFCNNNNSITHAHANEPASKPESKLAIQSGKYSEVSLAIDSTREVSGVYEYYDGWNESVKDSEDICVFYFWGNLINDSLAIINAGWPGSGQELRGKIRFAETNDTTELSIELDDQPIGYNDTNFTKANSFRRKLEKYKNWSEIRIVRNDRLTIYRDQDLKQRLGYLIKEDIVKVIRQNGNWLLIEYNSKGTFEKSIVGWIDEEGLYKNNQIK